MSDGGKGSARRRENTALVEANWPWPDKGESDGVREMPEDKGAEGCAEAGGIEAAGDEA